MTDRTMRLCPRCHNRFAAWPDDVVCAPCFDILVHMVRKRLIDFLNTRAAKPRRK
jgi:hypothetical protein